MPGEFTEGIRAGSEAALGILSCMVGVHEGCSPLLGVESSRGVRRLHFRGLLMCTGLRVSAQPQQRTWDSTGTPLT